MDNKVDPWKLLAELREHFGSCGGIPDHLWDITDAALAEHQNAESSDAQWIGYGQNGYTARVNDSVITVRSLGKPYGSYRDEYSWHISLWGDAPTEAEAKEAALKAARSLK